MMSLRQPRRIVLMMMMTTPVTRAPLRRARARRPAHRRRPTPSHASRQSRYDDADAHD